MKRTNDENIQVDATTGEVYISYPKGEKVKSAKALRIGCWLKKMLDNHVDRLVALRVYDNQWYDYRTRK